MKFTYSHSDIGYCSIVFTNEERRLAIIAITEEQETNNRFDIYSASFGSDYDEPISKIPLDKIVSKIEFIKQPINEMETDFNKWLNEIKRIHE